jgi:PPP family 3-phenylpropionic acid transporter
MPSWLRRPSANATWPFAALSASYFAHIGFFNPYLPLWLQDQGFSLLAISMLVSVQAATRMFAPYAWGWLSDTTGERVKLLRVGGTVALGLSLLLWWPMTWQSLLIVLFFMFICVFVDCVWYFVFWIVIVLFFFVDYSFLLYCFVS